MSFIFDHRQLADEMEIYCFNDGIGPGLPIWMPNGMALRDALESYMKELERRAGYGRVSSPHLARASLYRRSGHLNFFAGDLFPPMRDEDREDLYLKPMNCPHHHLAFASQPRSFRQLPVRFAEYGQVYRYEPSGSLKGLSRVRGLCQNDAHIYVAPEESLKELVSVLKMHLRCYRDLGLSGYSFRLSRRDSSRAADFLGAAESWERAEDLLRQALQECGLDYQDAPGEAAFYGPKIDVQMKMAGGNEESIASVQLDFVSGEKFDLSYVDSDGQSKVPWIIHRAPLGSHERFIAMLLEYFDGQLPGWLSPVQVLIFPAAEEDRARAEELGREWMADGIRCRVDGAAGALSKRLKFGRKLRPFVRVVVGEKERRSGVYRAEMRNGSFAGSEVEVRERLREEIAPPLGES